jgi:hypothetical protein
LITITVTNRLEVRPVDRIPGFLFRQIKNRLTFVNPARQEAEKRGFYAGHLPREIRGYHIDGDRLTLPRGCGRQVVSILHRAGVQYRIEDRRRVLSAVDFSFLGQLHDFQQEAVDAMASSDFGTLAAPTGSGKTLMALGLIARRKQPALIVVLRPAPRKDKAKVYDYLGPVGVLENAARTRQRVYGGPQGG